ncbi:hypothetical protein AgCh_032174 [Apium graveolens]
MKKKMKYTITAPLTMTNKLKYTTTKQEEQVGEDRLSGLPDELIHHILQFLDARLAVQTSARWKLIWTTLPFLNFRRHDYVGGLSFTSSVTELNFINHIFSFRNHDYEMLKLNLSFGFQQPRLLVYNALAYAFLGNIRHLNLDYVYHEIALTTFSSNSLTELKLKLYVDAILESDCWNLPALQTLHLINVSPIISFPASYLTCMRSLRDLLLSGFFELPQSVCLPVLTTLYLARCRLPSNVRGFPALTSLTLDSVAFPANASISFLQLVNLRNLTLFFRDRIMDFCYMSIPELVNLEINDCTTSLHDCEIIILSRKIVNFSSVGYLPMRLEVTELENVNIKLRDSTECKTIQPTKKMKKYFRQVNRMFPALGNARTLTLDLETIKALTIVSEFLVRSLPPFHNLIYVKVPPGYEESSMSAYLRCYLLGGSPKATIVTTLPKDELIPQMLPVSLNTQNLLPKNLLATPSDGQASSTKGISDLGLWQGYMVNYEFISLLDSIAKKYPETFDCFTTKSMELCTLKLNMLCATVKAFTNTSITKIDAEIITEYRALFSDLQRSFNVNWLVDRLNYIEQQFSQPLLDKFQEVGSLIGYAKSKSQDLHALRRNTIKEIHGDGGTVGSSLFGNIGDDMFSGP